MSDSAHRIAEKLTARIEPLEIEFYDAYWESQVRATPENDERRAELELQLRKVKGDPDALEEVNEALADPVHDPLLRRELEVLRLSLIADQMSDDERERLVKLASAVETDFAAFRPQIDGRTLTENDIDEVLRTSNDEDERRATWLASKQIGGQVAERVRELARIRNDAARNLGFADFYRMELELQEIPETWLFDVFEDLDRLTSEPFARWKAGLDAGLAERFSTETIYPWHYADPFFQSLPPDGAVSLDDVFGDVSAEKLALDTFNGWGIDLSDVIARSDLYPRELKCQHAFCISIDRAEDVRMLCNIVPGERWVDTMLHESGHAAYDVSIDRRLPFLLRTPAHTFVTEAVALLSGRLVRHPQWLKQIAEVDEATVRELAPGLKRAEATQSLLFSRWVFVMVHFERELYSDPEGDLDERWWDLVERFQLVPRPPDAPEGAWASKIHVAAAPVYYHNYLLGDMLASQLTKTAVNECGGLVGSRDAGQMFIDRVFRPGASVRWDALIEAATGRPLGAEDFAEHLAS